MSDESESTKKGVPRVTANGNTVRVDSAHATVSWGAAFPKDPELAAWIAHAINIAINDAIEECAKVADRKAEIVRYDESDGYSVAQAIAEDIRRLKGPP